MKSDAVTVSVGAPRVKTAELIVGLIRLPLVSDQAILDKLTPMFLDKLAPYNAEVRNPRFRKATPISEELIYDVYEPPPQSPSPVPWVAVLAILLAVAVAIIIVLYVRIVELERVLEDVGKDIEAVIAQKEQALAEGKISEDYAAELNDALLAAKKRAEEAGRTDWWNMLGAVIEYLPLVLIGLGAIAVIGMLPRPRRD